MIAVGPLSAQNMESLPDDPRISKGEIAICVKYYLIDNDIRNNLKYMSIKLESLLAPIINI